MEDKHFKNVNFDFPYSRESPYSKSVVNIPSNDLINSVS